MGDEERGEGGGGRWGLKKIEKEVQRGDVTMGEYVTGPRGALRVRGAKGKECKWET